MLSKFKQNLKLIYKQKTQQHTYTRQKQYIHTYNLTAANVVSDLDCL